MTHRAGLGDLYMKAGLEIGQQSLAMFAVMIGVATKPLFLTPVATDLVMDSEDRKADRCLHLQLARRLKVTSHARDTILRSNGSAGDARMRFSRTGPTQSAPQNAIAAAQYLRVSTEHQKYSIENQASVIAAYAEQRGLTVVRTYLDDGKSGLQLKGRAALKQLIDDAQKRNCDFGTLLVFDVSRWGRFQDVDESAYYEFICKEAGIAIHYCAEQFVNDGSLIASLVKNIKRTMAAEYSRQLSARVFAGQCRLVVQGYRQGGVAGYGLRRLLIDQSGKPKLVLLSGQYKNLNTDRVILKLGPPEEVALVRRIYDLFVFKKRSEITIAKLLNSEGKVHSLGNPWTYDNVCEILTNEKYIGNMVFNRSSRKLHQREVANSPDMWIRARGCFEPLINSKLFFKAQLKIRERKDKHADKYLLDCLRALLAKEGRISKSLIDSSKQGPTTSAYKEHFGGLLPAYKLIGYEQIPSWRILSHDNRGHFVKGPPSVASKLLAHTAACARKRRPKARKDKQYRDKQYAALKRDY